MSSEVQGAAPASQPDPAASTSAPSSAPSSSGAGVTAATTIANIGDLEKKAKPLYDAMTMAMTWQIINAQNDSNDRIKEILDKEAADNK